MKTKTYSILVMAVLLALGSVVGVKGQGVGYHTQQMGGNGGGNSIHGKVLLPDGKPAARVKVTITSVDIGSDNTMTDSDGTFKFGGLLKGNFTVSSKVEGYPNASEFVSIDRGGPSGQTAQVILYIRAEGQPKGAANPMLADISKDAVKKYQKAGETSAKDPKAAIVLLDEAIGLHPQFALAYYEKGLLYQKQNDLDNALAAFVKAIEIKPDYVDAKLQFGSTSLSMKNYEVAAQVFLDVIKAKNEMPLVYLYLGKAFVGLKQNDNAEKAFKQALALKGGENLAEAHRYLGGLYLQKNQTADAIAELQKYVELQPKAPDADKIKTTIEDLKKKKG
jgi:Tfp pilus assembly protein PilF